MITETELSELINAGRDAGQTPPLVRELILSAVDRAARRVYREDYPVKCAQTAGAICRLLEKVGIRQQLWLGAVCLTQVSSAGELIGWNGFWGSDHHAWVQTEFNELVDLSISQLHSHPISSHSQAPVPALWYSVRRSMPPIMKYLPDTIVSEVDPEGERELYNRFLKEAEIEFKHSCSQAEPGKKLFYPLLSDVREFPVLESMDDPWVIGSKIVLSGKIPLPDWILAREQELVAASASGQPAPSRLQNQTGLMSEIISSQQR